MIGHPDDNHQHPTLCVSQHSTSPPSSDRLRTAFLHKLGILEDRYRQPPTTQKESSLLGPVAIRHEPLKGTTEDEPEDQANTDDGNAACRSDTLFTAMAAASFLLRTSPSSSPASSPSSTSSSSMPLASRSHDREEQPTTTCPRGVRFDERVTVIPIPKHDEYSTRILRCLWDPKEVMLQNVQRNTLEFSADGWDWNAVAEEGDHYACPATGELIHPIHVECAHLERLELEETIEEGVPTEQVAARPP